MVNFPPKNSLKPTNFRPDISVDISSSELWSGFKDCKDKVTSYFPGI